MHNRIIYVSSTKHPEYLEEKKKKVKINSDILGFEKPKSAFKVNGIEYYLKRSHTKF